MIKIFETLKLILINSLIFFVVLIIIEIIFGSWFKNNFNLRLSSERNINRVYNFDFKNHKGQSKYIRDNLGFRVKEKNIKPNEVDIVFAGGSTINQKFLNYDETIVGLIQKRFDKINIVNSGVDGISIVGHINSFELWYNKIDNFRPKYYIFFIGLNDRYILDDNKKRPVDQLIESSFEGRIREYLESNSFFYKQFRKIKSILYLKFGFKKGANHVNEKSFVYAERNNNDFVKYSEILNKKDQLNYKGIYNKYLKDLTDRVLENNSKIIYITQTSGYGMSDKLFIIANTIMDHCKNNNLTCFNAAKDINFEYSDFYDGVHLNRKGTEKISIYLYKNLSKILN